VAPQLDEASPIKQPRSRRPTASRIRGTEVADTMFMKDPDSNRILVYSGLFLADSG